MDRDLKELLQTPILIYGFGKIGKITTQALLMENADIIGIAVSDCGKIKEKYKGIEVNSPEYFWEKAPNATVLIATMPTHHKDIQRKCLETGFKNIIPMTVELKNKLFCIFYRKWFLKEGILSENDHVIVGGGKYLDPFSILKQYSSSYLDEFGDFIIPAIYGDYEMVNEGPYEFDEVKLSKNDIVFDLGANLGLFSVYAVSKGCISYAFEPNPQLHEIITAHSKLNSAGIKLVPFATSNNCGTTTLQLDIVHNTSSTIMPAAYGDKSNPEIPVQQITIDEFVNREGLKHVDFIKADIEGAERLMLEGAQETLKRFAPKLSLCTYHLPDDKAVMTNLILKANSGYKIKYKWKKLYAYV